MAPLEVCPPVTARPLGSSAADLLAGIGFTSAAAEVLATPEPIAPVVPWRFPAPLRTAAETTWSADPALTDTDWQNIIDAVFEAAPVLTPREVARGKGTPGLNSAFHEEIVNALAARGLSPWPGTKADNTDDAGRPDVDIFGYPGEIKTASDYSISSNKSYAGEIDGSAERLMIATYFDIRPVEDGMAIVPYLITAGFIGPNDYKPSDSRGQLVTLREEAYAKFDTLWIPPFDELPSHLVPGFSKAGKMLERFGSPATIGGLRAAAAAAGDERLTARLAELSVEAMSATRAGLRWFDPVIRYPSHPKLRAAVARP